MSQFIMYYKNATVHRVGESEPHLYIWSGVTENDGFLREGVSETIRGAKMQISRIANKEGDFKALHDEN